MIKVEHITSFMIIGSLFFACSDQTNKPYDPTWESLAKHPTPKWFDDAKFGIFIHWGVYSVPAWAPKNKNAEWYPHEMYQKGEPTYEYHRKHYGDQGEFGYKDFIPQFKAENWDPEEWAELFEKAGAKYIVPVAEHHDGFAMWDSDLTEWDAMDMGPKRDIIGELGQAVRARGLKYAPSYHRARLWFYYPYDKEFDTSDTRYSGLYLKPHKSNGSAWPDDETEPPDQAFLSDWKKRWEEYRDKYQPDFLWFDGMWGLDSAFLELDKQIIADYYNKAIEWGKEVGVNNKGGTFRRRGLMPVEVGDWIEGDYMSQDSILTIKWQNPRPISHSFAFNRNEEPEDYRTTNELIDEMIDIVSKNGNLLLDVGPRADGTIPDIQRDRLLGIGKWMELNGEAIYGTRPWQHYGEEKVRFTQKQQENVLYAILLEWPGESVTIKTAKDMDIENIHMLGIRSELTWQINQEGLWIECPETRPCDHAYVLKITLS